MAKRLGLLREFLPIGAARFGALVNPSAATTEAFVKDFTAAAATLSVQFEIVQARDDHEIEVAFATLARNKNDALMVAPDTFFASRNAQIATLAMRHTIPAVYTVRAYVEHGGLMSYGPSLAGYLRQLGHLCGSGSQGRKARRPTCGAADQIRPRRSTCQTATALGLEIPPRCSPSRTRSSNDASRTAASSSRCSAVRRPPGRSRHARSSLTRMGELAC